MFLPEEDKFTYRQKELLDQLCVAMGGRVAEETYFWQCNQWSSWGYPHGHQHRSQDGLRVGYE